MNDPEKLNQDKEQVLSSEPKYPTDTFPNKYVHCVFENRQDAEQAVQALLTAGFTADDINFMESQHFIEAAVQGENENKSLAKTLSHAVSSMDHNVTDAYLAEARRGYDILSVRISRTDQMTLIRDILAQHNAKHIQYLDTWTRADLSGYRHSGNW